MFDNNELIISLTFAKEYKTNVYFVEQYLMQHPTQFFLDHCKNNKMQANE